MYVTNRLLIDNEKSIPSSKLHFFKVLPAKTQNGESFRVPWTHWASMNIGKIIIMDQKLSI